MNSPARSPNRSPIKKAMMITQGQKQALIDNLQLEITERARKLRAQYALQAQSLRTRVELRVNRIPASLRKANMGELLVKYMESTKRDQDPTSTTSKVLDFTSNDTKAKALPSKIVPQEKREVTLTGGGRTRGIKRSSDVLTSTDKENASDPSQPLPNPKKRLKASGNGTIHHTHNPSTVLSPKSSNSRTLPHSPIRPPLGSPQKSYLSRPISPLKPASPVKAPLPVKAAVAAATAATANLASLVSDQPKATRSRAASGRKATNPTTAAKPTVTRPKRGVTKTQPAAELRSVSNGSNTSSTSTGTTVVKKGAKATPAPTKKPVGISAAGKKLAAGPKVVEGPATGRRVLRKRA